MNQLNIRHGVVNEVYNALEGLIENPPRMGSTSAYKPRAVDLGKVRETLNEIRPYWDAYTRSLDINKPGSYTYQNMQADESIKYDKCIWWIALLEEQVRDQEA